MSLVTPVLRTLLAVVVLASAAGCSVAVPAGTAPAIGALRVADPGTLKPGTLNPGTLNRAEQLLPKVNAQPWAAPLYAVVTLDGGAQYGLCGNGTSPMEAEDVAGPAFPGPWIQDGQTARLGNMVCERAPGAMTCAHLRTGHGFMIGTDDYELW